MNFSFNKKIKYLVLLFLTQTGIVSILCSWDMFIYKLYPFLFSVITHYLKSIFSFFCIDIGNIFYCILVIVIPLGLYKAFKSKIIIETLLLYLNCIFFLYFLLWGFNYYNTIIVDRFMPKSVSDRELIDLTEYLFNKTKEYSVLTKRNNKNEFIIENKDSLYPKLLLSQNFPLKNKTPTFFRPEQSIINVKPSIFSLMQSYIGIAGVYNPFSAEAIYNNNMPDIKIPFTVSHEMAHQLGYASETEANFIGFLTAINTKDNNIKYAAYYSALKYAMRTLYENTPVLYFFYFSRYNKQMKIDYNQEMRYYKTYNSEAENYFSYTNDLFLKLNSQKEGINSYNKFVYMLVTVFKKKNMNN